MQKQKGFTLIELLIVIAIIAILAVVIFVALNPLRRFQDSRDAVRWQDIESIADAIQLYQVDNNGNFITSIDGMSNGPVYMIVDGGYGTGCDDYNGFCDTNVSGDNYCVNLIDLVTDGYFGDVPVAPNSGNVSWDEARTGYTLEKDATGIITVRACESENSTEILLVK